MTTVEVNLDELTLSSTEVLNNKTGTAIGKKIRRETIDLMSKGISPVKGKRRFVRYKNPNKYPKDKKPRRPVNLKLSGDLHNSLAFKTERSKSQVVFGLLNPKGDVEDYAPVHNRDDISRPDIPERAFVPNKRGQQFNRTIDKEIQKIVAKRIDFLLRKKNSI